MKTSQILAAAALSLFAVAGAQAETYEGVHTAASTKSREEVHAEAMRTASAPDQNVTRGSRVNSKVISNMQHPMDVDVQAQQGSSPVAK
ncbi:hypothetical protein CLU95_0873 [Variovorax sp. 54]|uniref:DUF4148 domain-containing protein n=1 Tax=Variovorax sp. 54 TaxID=2035212 RepID=UPI000C186CA6|nr:DUF4148 domain-containing protein [Variovorax sp. 54]PIF73765.1 hypothetical protein CLU95_0873 [Variovorax sp. 54]